MSPQQILAFIGVFFIVYVLAFIIYTIITPECLEEVTSHILGL